MKGKTLVTVATLRNAETTADRVTTCTYVKSTVCSQVSKIMIRTRYCNVLDTYVQRLMNG